MDQVHRAARRCLNMCSRMASILDWVILIAIFAFAGTLSAWLPPTTRPFLINLNTDSTNPTVINYFFSTPSYPFLPDTVSTTALILVSIMTPFLVLILHTTLHTLYQSTLAPFKQILRPNLRFLNSAFLGLATSLATTLFLTESLKSLVGKQRPDFASRCGDILVHLLDQYSKPSIAQNGPRMVTWEVCKNFWPNTSEQDLGSLDQTPSLTGILKDGWRSFPSGHASLSFSGMTYLSLYIALVLFRFKPPRFLSISQINHRKNTRTETITPSIPALLLMSTPILAAAYISLSRYSDFKHSGIDILAGSAIGILGATVGWRVYGTRILIRNHQLQKKDDKEAYMEGSRERCTCRFTSGHETLEGNKRKSLVIVEENEVRGNQGREAEIEEELGDGDGEDVIRVIVESCGRTSA